MKYKKHNAFRRGLTLLLVFALLVPLSVVPVKAEDGESSQTDTYFYESLANLIAEQDSSNYVGLMQLVINSKILSIDGEEILMDAAPVLTEEKRTMLPIRPVAEALGCDVYFDSSTRSAVVVSPFDVEIRCPIGEKYITVNGETIALDVASYIENGRTYLPVRAVGEALNLTVDWNSEIQGVDLTAPWQTSRIIVQWDELDPKKLSSSGSITAIHDGNGMWVVQYDNPAEAYSAAEALTAQGITVGPDLYVPPVTDDTVDGEAVVSALDAEFSSQAVSWGVDSCNFSSYINQYSEVMSKYSSVVAVVDTGVDASHSFLQGKVLTGYDFVDGDSNASDGHYHGTHVAATIIDCTSGAPVQILPIRVLDSNGAGYSSTIVSGIKYAADQGADVINLSLGGTRTLSSALDDAVNYALNKGASVVIAAGNESMNTALCCPAHITTDGTIVVSAGDSSKTKASFSNYGDSVDVMAPGVKIEAAVPGNTYKSLSGTSMATPHVAAAVALIDLATEKTYTVAQLESAIRTATTYGTWTDQYQGCGFLDMSKAPGNAVSAPTPNLQSYEFSVSSLSLRTGGTADVQVYAVYSDGSTQDVTSSAGLTSSDSSVVTVSSDGTVTAQASGTATISTSLTDGPAPITVTVEDQTPVSYQFNTSSLTLKIGETADFKLYAVYEDGSREDVTSTSFIYLSNMFVVEVSSGTVTAKRTGTVQLRVLSLRVLLGSASVEPLTVTVTDN